MLTEDRIVELEAEAAAFAEEMGDSNLFYPFLVGALKSELRWATKGREHEPEAIRDQQRDPGDS